jgi:Tol biopolymer transport system component
MVHRVNAAGQDERFDFINIPEGNWEGVDWVISPDGTQIVWMRSLFETGEDYDITLTSELYVTTISTGETRLLTTQAVNEHRTLTPWGMSPDGSRVFVYQQPYGIGGLFLMCGEFSVLDVATGQLTPLPDPMPLGHFGAAALSDDGARLARFGYTEGEGFKVNLTDLASGQTTEVVTPSTDLGFAQVGDGVFSPDGSTLIYTVAYGVLGREGFALFQVDFTTGTQRELLAPQPTHYKVAHFEDDGSLLLTIAWPGEGTGTFRLHPDGTLEHLSEATFVGISQ